MARIVALTSRLPFPPREGHQLRSWHLLRALAARHEVTLLSFMRSDDDVSGLAQLEKTFARVETFPIAAEHSRGVLAGALVRGMFGTRPFVAEKYFSRAMFERCAELATETDLLHVDMLPLMRCADAFHQSIPVALNAHNVEHELLEQRARVESSPLRRVFLRRQMQRVRDFELAACRRADLILACSDIDRGKLQSLAPQSRIETIANGVDLETNVASAGAPGCATQLVFVGQMGWFPNRDGVDWFLAAVLPRVLAARPDAEFVVVGREQGLQVPAALADRVRLTGFVADVRVPVLESAVYVVPLRVGSGTRLKVLEAMALGRAIVTTHVGAEGIALTDGIDALFADDADAFAAAVLRLLAEPAMAAQLGRNARQLAERRYGWKAIGNALLECCDDVLTRRTATK